MVRKDSDYKSSPRAPPRYRSDSSRKPCNDGPKNTSVHKELSPYSLLKSNKESNLEMMNENIDHKSSPRAPARADMTSDDNSGSSTDNFEVIKPPKYRSDSSRKP